MLPTVVRAVRRHPGQRVSRQHPGETYRHAIDARRAGGGGACTILVRRIGESIELLFHATPATGAALTSAQAEELADALAQAAR